MKQPKMHSTALHWTVTNYNELNCTATNLNKINFAVMYCIATNKTQCTALQTITLCALHATHLCALHCMHLTYVHCTSLHWAWASSSVAVNGARRGTQQAGRKASKVFIVFPLPSNSTIFILFAFRWILQFKEFTCTPRLIIAVGLGSKQTL